MADRNQDKANSSNSDVELDPIVQGASRVRGQREEDARLDSANIDETQDTQTRANIHLGSREAEGSGLEHEQGQGFPSSSTENTQVEGSPVHTNIEQAEVKLSAFMAEEFEPEAETESGNSVLTAGIATSELSFDPIAQNTTTPQVGEVQPGATVQTIESGSRQPFVPENLAANVPPVASDDVGVLTEDEAFTLNVLNNDKDANTDSEQLFIVDATVDGGLGAVSHDGTNITFNPGSAYDYLDDGETETVTITYSISDGEGGTDTATLTLEIVGSNDAPVVNAVDLGTTAEDTSVTFSAYDLLANSSDVDGDSLSVTSVTVGEDLGT
ncbi:T1SS secreted agglutinin RTX, partial [hydrothermal vent metagenome]